MIALELYCFKLCVLKAFCLHGMFLDTLTVSNLDIKHANNFQLPSFVIIFCLKFAKYRTRNLRLIHYKFRYISLVFLSFFDEALQKCKKSLQHVWCILKNYNNQLDSEHIAVSSTGCNKIRANQPSHVPLFLCN